MNQQLKNETPLYFFMVLEGLEPKSVWWIFEHILTRTPRPSKHEEKIREKIRNWVEQKSEEMSMGLETATDSVGNLIVKIPATEGLDHIDPLLFQVHMDMVCESNRPDGFNFENNAIPLNIQEDGQWIDADGTTLGADDGIGVALILALITETDDRLRHGRLEMLFTVDEETGLTGAFELDVEKLEIRSKCLINVDSEDVGAITIGSAGGGDTILSRKTTMKTPSSDTIFISFSLCVSGLLGGHSGVDIHQNRANANKIIAEILEEANRSAAICIQAWNGGDKHNAIPRESQVFFSVPMDDEKRLKKTLAELIDEKKRKIGQREPGLELDWNIVENGPCLSHDASYQIIRTMIEIPHGVIAYSTEIDDLVETSNNLAVISTSEETMNIKVSSRSSKDEKLDEVRNLISDIGNKYGWDVKKLKSYPGWTPDPDNDFLRFVHNTYEEQYCDSVKIEAVHAGLETSVIGAKIPGIQMVSIGPTVENPHTPQERVNIKSVGILFRVLKKLVQNFPAFSS